jgi:hypothetical protein
MFKYRATLPVPSSLARVTAFSFTTGVLSATTILLAVLPVRKH